MKFFVDTEFISDGHTIDLVSIAIVSAEGKEFYAENKDAVTAKAIPWVQKNVLAHLTGPSYEKWELRDMIYGFLAANGDGKPPEFWGDYCAFDFVILSQIFGTFDDWPGSWPFYMHDLQQHQEWTNIHAPTFRPSDEPEHHALADARQIRRQYRWIAEEIERLQGESEEGDA